MSDVQMFVLWQHARVEETRILADIAARAEILVSFEGRWPEGVSAAEGFRRFYGNLLPDADEKAKRAGAGAFRVVIVRFAEPRQSWHWTRRGLEFVNAEVQELKDTYRSWVGGQNRVHGTLTPSEAAHDILMMTGHTAAEWSAGGLTAADVEVLPGQAGWRNLAEMFRFLNKAHPYVVLRNGEGLPDAFDPTHEDIDMLAESASECAGCLGARKVKKAGRAAYVVRVAGTDVKMDIREVGDDYYDERWERGILARRVLQPRGVFEPGPDDAYYSLAYHALFQKPRIAPDYYGKLTRLAGAAGRSASTPDAWFSEMSAWMDANHYAFVKPKDPSVRPNLRLANWRREADEAAALFGLTDVQLTFPSFRPLEFTGTLENAPCHVWFGSGASEEVRRAYELAQRVWKTDPRAVAEPLRWHASRRGGFYVGRLPAGPTLQGCLDRGAVFTPEQLTEMAASAQRLVKSLETAGIVHRDIRPETIRVAPDGSLSLDGFTYAIARKDYRCEPTFLRRALTTQLIPLGGEGVLHPGEWNDRFALAAALRRLPSCAALSEVIARLESEAKAGKGSLRMNPRKLRPRLLKLYLEVTVRGLLSPRRRKSAIFRRIRSFVGRALF